MREDVNGNLNEHCWYQALAEISAGSLHKNINVYAHDGFAARGVYTTV